MAGGGAIVAAAPLRHFRRPRAAVWLACAGGHGAESRRVAGRPHAVRETASVVAIAGASPRAGSLPPAQSRRTTPARLVGACRGVRPMLVRFPFPRIQQSSNLRAAHNRNLESAPHPNCTSVRPPAICSLCVNQPGQHASCRCFSSIAGTISSSPGVAIQPIAARAPASPLRRPKTSSVARLPRLQMPVPRADARKVRRSNIYVSAIHIIYVSTYTHIYLACAARRGEAEMPANHPPPPSPFPASK